MTDIQLLLINALYALVVRGGDGGGGVVQCSAAQAMATATPPVPSSGLTTTYP